MAAKLKTGDRVVVLAGNEKGVEGVINSVNPKAQTAIVGGVNLRIRHTKQSQTDRGGRVPKEMPLHLSNLALIDSEGKRTRVGFRFEDGQRVRFHKTTGQTI
ncbi:MAG: 50S ribosomal protein L24 [Aestuariivita sp.]|nr:50S ribosomal protein L24 [Aestuariivita sp.]MCY4347216.1 50S ribosomal protein L24 [Aestuariivita sp.]